MRKAICITLLALLTCNLMAEDSIAVDSLPTSRIPILQAMQERVSVKQSIDIEQVIVEKITGEERVMESIQGYRVQVFSDNNPHSAKTEAFDLEKRLEAADLGYEIFVLYNQPFWKVRIGNFTNQEDALNLRDELRRRFPDIQGDIYVVRDQIQVRQ